METWISVRNSFLTLSEARFAPSAVPDLSLPSGESELEALHEHTTIYFNLLKQKIPLQVDEIGLLLKKTESRRNRFTLEVTSNSQNQIWRYLSVAATAAASSVRNS